MFAICKFQSHIINQTFGEHGFLDKEIHPNSRNLHTVKHVTSFLQQGCQSKLWHNGDTIVIYLSGMRSFSKAESPDSKNQIHGRCLSLSVGRLYYMYTFTRHNSLRVTHSLHNHETMKHEVKHTSLAWFKAPFHHDVPYTHIQHEDNVFQITLLVSHAEKPWKTNEIWIFDLEYRDVDNDI